MNDRERFVNCLAGGEVDRPPYCLKWGPCPPIERETTADDGECVTWRDGWGILRRNPVGSESMSAFLDYPVKGRADRGTA